MNKAHFISLFFIIILLGCEKKDSIENNDFPIEVSVKVVDAICTDLILEIQDDTRKHLGEKNFEYNGQIYNGAISIKDAQCLSDEILKNIYEESGLNKTRTFKVRLTYTGPYSPCTKPTCAAKLSKLPSKMFYIP